MAIFGLPIVDSLEAVQGLIAELGTCCSRSNIRGDYLRSPNKIGARADTISDTLSSCKDCVGARACINSSRCIEKKESRKNGDGGRAQHLEANKTNVMAVNQQPALMASPRLCRPLSRDALREDSLDRQLTLVAAHKIHKRCLRSEHAVHGVDLKSSRQEPPSYRCGESTPVSKRFVAKAVLRRARLGEETKGKPQPRCTTPEAPWCTMTVVQAIVTVSPTWPD